MNRLATSTDPAADLALLGRVTAAMAAWTQAGASEHAVPFLGLSVDELARAEEMMDELEASDELPL